MQSGEADDVPDLGFESNRNAAFDRAIGLERVEETYAESFELLRCTIEACCRNAIKRKGADTRARRDREIVTARYGLGVEEQTLEKIAEQRNGITREAVRQYEKQALEHLRTSDFLCSEPVRAHLAWLNFNDGLILPERTLPKATLPTYRLLCDLWPERFVIFCDLDEGLVIARPWPISKMIGAFKAFPKLFTTEGPFAAKQTILDCIPFAPSTEQFDRSHAKISRWAENRYHEQTIARRTNLVRSALERIGKTAHFSSIAREAASIEGVAWSAQYEHAIHSVLGLRSNLFARPGGRGMYALAASGISTTSGLTEDMRRVVLASDRWLSARSIWERLPRGHHFTVSSIGMTATQHPEFFRTTSFGLIANAEDPEPEPTVCARALVAAYLDRVGNATRADLHRDLDAEDASDELDAVLARDRRILRIGSKRELAYIHYVRPISDTSLTKIQLIETVMADFGLRSRAEAAQVIYDRFRITVDLRRHG